MTEFLGMSQIDSIAKNLDEEKKIFLDQIEVQMSVNELVVLN